MFRSRGVRRLKKRSELQWNLAMDSRQQHTVVVVFFVFVSDASMYHIWNHLTSSKWPQCQLIWTNGRILPLELRVSTSVCAGARALKGCVMCVRLSVSGSVSEVLVSQCPCRPCPSSQSPVESPSHQLRPPTMV